MYSFYGPSSTAVEQTAGLTYNAQTAQWVASSSSTTSSSSINNPSVTQYSQQPQVSTVLYNNNNSFNQQQTPANNTRTPPPNPVVAFTSYYHGWKDIADGKRPIPPGLNKAWAKYYADSSSRAAHFFHANPQATMADFDLPPAPPPETSVPPGASSNNVSQQQQQQQQQHPVGNSTGIYPYSSYSQQQQQQQQQQQPSNYYAQQPYTQNVVVNSQTLTYQQYMEKCLQQCCTEQERAEMHQKLQQVIQQAVVDGEMTSDWSSKPLIPVSRAVPQHKVSGQQAPTYGASDVSYYGPSATVPPDIRKRPNMTPKEQDRKKKRRWDASPLNASAKSPANNQTSYYGPSDTSVGSTSSQKRSKQPKLSSDNFYGPSRATSITNTNPSNSSKNKKWKRNDSGFDKSNTTLNERARRFASSCTSQPSFDEDSEMTTQGPIVKGTCQILEKDYLRLTSAPRPELVRPKPILEKHLANLLAERKDETNRRDYLWFCSQLKALRQDLTVQHIRDSLTVLVYETHARIALEEGDLNEYNQCQTQLKYLYEQFESEGGEESTKALANRDEFVAYRLLYSVLLTQNEKYQGGSSDLMKILQSLTTTQRHHPAIQFSNRIRTAVAEGNYHLFFASLKDTEGGSHAVYFLQRLVPSMRKLALPRMLRAYRPLNVPMEFVLQELAFGEDKEYGKRWLQSCGCVFSENGKEILCKESEYRESDLEEKKSLI